MSRTLKSRKSFALPTTALSSRLSSGIMSPLRGLIIGPILLIEFSKSFVRFIVGDKGFMVRMFGI